MSSNVWFVLFGLGRMRCAPLRTRFSIPLRSVGVTAVISKPQPNHSEPGKDTGVGVDCGSDSDSDILVATFYR